MNSPTNLDTLLKEILITPLVGAMMERGIELPVRWDECGRTPVTYTFHGTESSSDEFGRFEWNQTYHFCSECFAELKPDFKRRYDADMAESV